MSWASLDFQPFFTATASNIGYGWWSHDIGGHMFGAKDDELATRWVQLGAFSPIMRLHSTADRFNSKEPWRFGPEAERIMGDWLRFRHRLVPYLYTMNQRAHAEGTPLVRPMYHTHPRREAYVDRNQFWFGSSLLVAPITSPADPATGLGAARAWLPEGRWIDIFTGVLYDGGRTVVLHRSLADYPVLAQQGAIVPLTGEGVHGIDNPVWLELIVAAGDDGTFTLYEDDDAAEPSVVTTRFSVDWANGTFTIHPAQGDLNVVPPERDYTVTFVGVADNRADGVPSVYDHETARLSVDLANVATATGANVRLVTPPKITDNRVADRVFALLDRAQIAFDVKDAVDRITASGLPLSRQLADLHALDLDEHLHSAVVELVAAGVA